MPRLPDQRRRGITLERRGGSWSVRTRTCGIRIRRDFRDEAAAVAFADELARARETGSLLQIVHSDDPLSVWFDRWLVDFAPCLQPTTVYVYIDAYTNHVEPALGAVPIGALYRRVQPWANRLFAPSSPVGRPIAVKALSVLSSVCRFAVMSGAMMLNPVKALELPPRRTPPPVYRPVATPMFVERMRQLVGPGDELLICLMAYAGLRPQEALATPPAAVHRRSRELWVGHSITLGRVSAIKNHKPRAVPLLDALEDILIAAVDRHGEVGPSRPLTCGPDGAPWSAAEYRNFRSRFHRAARWAGDPLQAPRDLRAAYATMMLESGESLHAVARHLGDREDTVQRHYYRYRSDAERTLPPNLQIAKARASAAASPPQRAPGRLRTPGRLDVGR
jgi:integrase